MYYLAGIAPSPAKRTPIGELGLARKQGQPGWTTGVQPLQYALPDDAGIAIAYKPGEVS